MFYCSYEFDQGKVHARGCFSLKNCLYNIQPDIVLVAGQGKKFPLGKTFKPFDLCIVNILKSYYVSSLESISGLVKVCLCHCNIMNTSAIRQEANGKRGCS